MTAAKLADLLGQMANNDVELNRLHQARPAGVALHLRSAELEARQLDAFDTVNPSIASTLSLPDFAHSSRSIWPVPAPAASFTAPVAEHPGIRLVAATHGAHRGAAGRRCAGS